MRLLDAGSAIATPRLSSKAAALERVRFDPEDSIPSGESEGAALVVYPQCFSCRLLLCSRAGRELVVFWEGVCLIFGLGGVQPFSVCGVGVWKRVRNSEISGIYDYKTPKLS